VNLTLMHEGNEVREFYSQLPRPVLVGIEATGSKPVLMRYAKIRRCRRTRALKVTRTIRRYVSSPTREQ